MKIHHCTTTIIFPKVFSNRKNQSTTIESQIMKNRIVQTLLYYLEQKITTPKYEKYCQEQTIGRNIHQTTLHVLSRIAYSLCGQASPITTIDHALDRRERLHLRITPLVFFLLKVFWIGRKSRKQRPFLGNLQTIFQFDFFCYEIRGHNSPLHIDLSR